MITKIKEMFKLNFSNIRFKYLYKTIEKSIKKKTGLVIKTNDKDRAIGKTKTLVLLSKKYNIPILVKSYYQVNYIKQTYKYNNVIHTANLNNIRGLNTNIVLIEEGFNDDDIVFLTKHFKAVIGFKYETKQ